MTKPELIKQLLANLVTEYVEQLEDHEDPDVLENTSDKDRISDFALYLNNR